MNRYRVEYPKFKKFPDIRVSFTCCVCSKKVLRSRDNKGGWFIVSFDVGPIKNVDTEVRLLCCSDVCSNMAGLQQEIP
jgi:hypothetical protein